MRSSTSTRRPARARGAATAHPASRAPTTMTSNRSTRRSCQAPPGAVSLPGDAVAAQVLEVERAQQVGDLALARVGDVVDVGLEALDVPVGLVRLAGGRLG